jgi:nucleoside-diphosphate-sugar epimerase
VTAADAAGARSSPWYPSDADRVIHDDLRSIVEACGPQMDRLAGKAILITGGTGFVGRYLVESILHHQSVTERGCLLGLLTRDPDRVLERYPDQVRDGSIVPIRWADAQVISAEPRRWDFVVHGATPADPIKYLKDPYGTLRDIVDMAVAVVEAARASASERILLLSSGAVYGPQPPDMAGLPETHLGGPDVMEASSCYGEGKRITELLCRLSGVDCKTARLFSLLGPYQDLTGSFAVPSMIRQAAVQGAIRLTGDGSAVRNYCYASDVTITLLGLLLGSPRRATYNIGNRTGTATIAQVAAMVAQVFGGVPVTVGQCATLEPARAARYVPRLEWIYEETAIAPPRIGLLDGLIRTCTSLHARGIIPRAPVFELDTGA